ncbi:MAG: YigZ family protein, partial [Bacilli bacterium]
LEKNCLNNTLAVVIRFFGGIKLGKGGLVRAYSKITSNAVKKAELIAIKNEKSFKIFFNIINSKKINYALKDCKIISKKFNKEIEYIIKSEKFPEDIDNLIIRKEVL